MEQREEGGFRAGDSVSDGVTRREFIRGVLAGALCVPGLQALETGRPPESPAAVGGDVEIRKARTLGRTGLGVSALTLGVSDFFDSAVVRHALRSGIDTVETSREYGYAEEFLGEVLRGHPRDRLTIVTKFAPHHRYDKVMESVNKSLRALRTDYIDVLLMHRAHDSFPFSIELETCLRAFADLKQAGKIRFCGASTHNLRYTVQEALLEQHLDVVMVFYNCMSPDGDGELLARARGTGIGVVAMKTLGGYGSRMIGADKVPSAMRYVLTRDFVDTAAIKIPSVQQLDMYLKIMEKPFSESDREHLRSIERKLGATHCRSCHGCAGQCPQRVRIPEVLRSLVYLEGCAGEGKARRHYRANAPDGVAAGCASCRVCRVRCHFGIDVRAQLARAARAFET